MDHFYTSVHQVEFLARSRRPLLLSRHRLAGEDGSGQRKTLPRARRPWVLDSGGFNALKKNGRYLVSARQYAAEACRYQREIGNLQWAATMDWMCEPEVRTKTGRSVRWHQRKTVESLLELRSIAPGVPWMPVVQGWDVDDYLECVALYLRNGIDLRAEPIVGVGTVCSRQGMADGERIVRLLAELDLRLHVFGYKRDGLGDVLPYCVSADSAAWSRNARNANIRLDGCKHTYRSDAFYLRDVFVDPCCRGSHGKGAHGTACVPLHRKGERHHRAGDLSDCRNCLRYAEQWSDELVEIARGGAAPDRIARFWGFRLPADEEVVRWQEEDPAEAEWNDGVSRSSELRGDYETAMARASNLAGVAIGSEVIRHFLLAPGHPCVPACHKDPGCPPAPVSEPAVRDLPPSPASPDAPLETFKPWGPTFKLATGGEATLLPPGRGAMTPHVAWLGGLELAASFFERPAAEEGAPSGFHAWQDAKDIWHTLTDGLDRKLSRHPGVLGLRARAVLEVRSNSERSKAFAAIQEGVLDGLWRLALAERPTWGANTRPDRKAPPEEEQRIRLGPPASSEELREMRELATLDAPGFRGLRNAELIEAMRAKRWHHLLTLGPANGLRRQELVAAWRGAMVAAGVAVDDEVLRALGAPVVAPSAVPTRTKPRGR